MGIRGCLAVAFAFSVAAGPACHRAVEPYDPDETVEAPDLSKIFPPGAARSREDSEPLGPATLRGAPPPSAGGAIQGNVRLAPDLEGRVPSGAVLFLVARNAQSGPPVAVKRIPNPRFPLDFAIGPGDRMIQGVPFAGIFRISARVDADHNAMTREPGDLQGEVRDVAPGARGVTIVIDEVL